MREAWAVLMLLASGLCACRDTFDPKNVPPQYAEVAEIHHARCGACHKRVEPGMRTRDKLEKALVKHRRRVSMTEDKWALLVDYLSEPPPPH